MLCLPGSRVEFDVLTVWRSGLSREITSRLDTRRRGTRPAGLPLSSEGDARVGTSAGYAEPAGAICGVSLAYDIEQEVLWLECNLLTITLHKARYEFL